MPDVVDPGTRLVERYRLDKRLGAPQHSGPAGTDAPTAEVTSYWQAHDELLDRPVSVCLLRAGNEHAGSVLRAARKAAVLTDSRFLRVLDASEVDGVVYVVSEWVSATNLVDLLADGPLDTEEARSLTLEVAGALAAAHDAGLSHLCLAPEHVLRTPHGQVKLAGLGVDAAARGVTCTGAAEAALLDTRAAAGLLYACLTARWPGTSPSTLPPAPRDGADPLSPRQVRAGVPDGIDSVVGRALGLTGRHGGRAVPTPAELVTALEGLPARAVPPRAAPPVASGPPQGVPTSATPAYVSVYDDEDPARARPRPTAVAWALVTLLLLAGLGLAGFQLLTSGQDDGAAVVQRQEKKSADAQGAAGEPVRVRTATSFDPPPGGNEEENSDRAAAAVDGELSTAWPTKTYFDPFGPSGLKDGVGLLLDLGEPRDVSRVTVRVQGGPTDLQVRVAQNPGRVLADFKLLASARADPLAEVGAREPVQARYVLVWLTSLPQVGGQFRGEVTEVVVDAVPR